MKRYAPLVALLLAALMSACSRNRPDPELQMLQAAARSVAKKLETGTTPREIAIIIHSLTNSIDRARGKLSQEQSLAAIDAKVFCDTLVTQLQSLTAIGIETPVHADAKFFNQPQSSETHRVAGVDPREHISIIASQAYLAARYLDQTLEPGDRSTRLIEEQAQRQREWEAQQSQPRLVRQQ